MLKTFIHACIRTESVTPPPCGAFFWDGKQGQSFIGNGGGTDGSQN